MNDLVKKLKANPLWPTGEYRSLTQEAADHIEAQNKLIEELQEALETFVEEYTEMVNSGDCGFWDPEKEDKVIAARAALSEASKSNPNTPERNDE